VIHITVTDPNPRLARRIANQVADSFKAQTEEIMQLESVTILDYAVIPSRPVSPRIPLNIAIALVVGLMVAAVWSSYWSTWTIPLRLRRMSRSSWACLSWDYSVYGGRIVEEEKEFPDYLYRSPFPGSGSLPLPADQYPVF